jgi:serine/threonine-protein kinase PpkA
LVAVAGIGGYLVFLRQHTPSTGYEITLGLPPSQKDRSTTAAEYERLAVEHFHRKEFQQSLELTRLGLATTPGDARLLALQERIEAYQRATDLLREATQRAQDGSFEQSLQLIGQGLQQVPNHPGLKALRTEVERQFRESKRQQARQLLAQARASRQQGRLGEAMNLIEQGLRLVPSDPDLEALRAQVATEAEKRKKADALLAEARKRQQQDALDESLALVGQGLQLVPDDPQLMELRRTVQDRQRQRRQARAAELLTQARQQRDQGALPKAMQLANEGLQQIPNDKDLLALRGQIQDQIDKQRKVADLVAQAHDRKGKNDLDDSLKLIDEALKLAPDQSDLLAFRVKIKAELDAKKRVDGLLRGCAAEFPLERLSAEGVDDAAACYNQVIALTPDNAEAQAKLDRIADLSADWVVTAISGGELDKAESLLTELSRLKPNYPTLADLTHDLKAKREEAAALAKQQADKEAQQRTQRELAPEMVSIKGGCYEMGSPPSEPEREGDEHQHKVCVKDFRIGKYEVKVRDFRRFVDATGYQTLAERADGVDQGCWTLDQSDQETPWKYRSWASWRKPNKYRDTQEDQPVSCVSWTDAEAYIHWLSGATGIQYRLPTEGEWEYAARAGTTTARFWGDGVDARACQYANVADTGHNWADGFPCDDGSEWVAPVGQYRPNPWGLYDILGNVSEWTCSPYDQSYEGGESKCMENDPAVPLTLRGGSWYSGPKPVRAAYRDRNYREVRYSFLGFRLAGD